MKYQIVDKRGMPKESKSIGGPNLDPAFFYSSSATGNIDLSELNAKPYQWHAWTYASANTIARNVSKLPKYLQDNRTDDKIYEHEILDLLEMPNPLMTQVQFFQFITLMLLLPSNTNSMFSNRRLYGGQVFIVPTKNGKLVDLQKGEMPDMLMPWPTHYFKPLLSKGENGLDSIAGWRFEVNGEKHTRIDFGMNEIIRVYLPNPYDFKVGMAPQTAGTMAIDQDSKADIYNSRIFDNDGRVAGVLTTDSEHMSEEQAKRWFALWYKMYGGLGKSGRIAVLGNGLKYTQFGQTLADMQWKEQKDWNKDQILSVFGLNKIAIGDYEDINFATIREGRKLLWEDTYLPMDNVILDSLNNQWLRYVAPNTLRLFSDISGIGALQEDNTKKLDSAVSMVNSGLPPELAFEMASVPIDEEHLNKWPYLRERITPVQITAIPENENNEDDNNDDKSKGMAYTKSIEINQDFEDPRVRQFEDEVLVPGESRFRKNINRYFVSQRNSAQDKVDEWSGEDNAPGIILLKPEIFLLGLSEWNEKLRKLYKPDAVNQAKIDVRALKKELGELINFEVTDNLIDDMVDKRMKILSGINELTFQKQLDRVSVAIKTGISDALTPQEMAKSIKSAIGEAYDTRIHNVNTIARTEMNTISSMTRFSAFQKEGINKTQWLTAMDSKVRNEDPYNHRRLNYQVANLGEMFVRSDGITTNLKYPRDPNGARGDVINCRCVAVAYFEEA